LGLGLELGAAGVSFGTGAVAIDPNDTKIPSSSISRRGLDLGFGAYYSIPNKLYFGVSVGHLTAPKLKDNTFNYTMARHIYVIGGYDIALPNNPDIVIRPGVILKTSLASTQLDINANVLYKNMIWGGLSYRVFGSDAIVPMLGYQKQLLEGKGMLRIGYSYDVTLSNLKGYSTGSHEIHLGFCYDITPPVKVTKYINVRSL
jgi:type IX secretion system PorP/SprF family membrane protein